MSAITRAKPSLSGLTGAALLKQPRTAGVPSTILTAQTAGQFYRVLGQAMKAGCHIPELVLSHAKCPTRIVVVAWNEDVGIAAVEGNLRSEVINHAIVGREVLIDRLALFARRWVLKGTWHGFSLRNR